MKPKRILSLLKKYYPQAETALKYRLPIDLLVATILSAQCTDKRVNLVTKELFKHYRTARDYANSSPNKLEDLIHSTGFYKNKAKNIIAASQIIVNKHEGIVPLEMKNLVTLPGVGRKTANVLLSTITGKHEGIVVDTHVLRLSQRIGLSSHKQPEKIEQDLMKQFAKKDWGYLSNALIIHGRTLCTARKAHCKKCFLNKQCKSAFKV